MPSPAPQPPDAAYQSAYNERRRSRYAQDADYRERRKADYRKFYREARRGESTRSGYRVYHFDHFAVVGASRERPFLSPDGVVVTDSAYVPVSGLAEAMQVQHGTLVGWIRNGLFPPPLCALYSATRREVYSLAEALTYAKLFADTLGGEEMSRPFIARPELITVLQQASVTLRARLCRRPGR